MKVSMTPFLIAPEDDAGHNAVRPVVEMAVQPRISQTSEAKFSAEIKSHWYLRVRWGQNAL